MPSKSFIPKIILLLSLCFSCISQLSGQTSEIKDFEQKNYKTFSSKGHPKNRGLLFSIKYPSNYTAQEIKNENIIKGFNHKDYHLIYMIGVVEKPAEIQKDEENVILSEENLKQSVSVYTNNDQTFLDYKNGLLINGMSAAYLDFMTNIADTKCFVRQYFIVYKNYLLTANFTVPKQPDGSLEEARKRFDNYKVFFQLAINTLMITK
jgi:hypothetical protein